MMDDIEKKHTVYNYEIITTTGQKAATCQAKLNSQFDVYRKDWELRRKQEIGRLNAEWEKVKATASKPQLTQNTTMVTKPATVKTSQIKKCGTKLVRVRSTTTRKCGTKLPVRVTTSVRRCGRSLCHGHCNKGSRRLCWYSPPRVVRPQVKATLR